MPIRSTGQWLVRRNPVTTWPLYLLAGGCFVWLVALAFGGDLGDEAIATVFSASLLLILVRYRDADRMPLIGYTSGWYGDAEDLARAGGRFRRVALYNEGPGVAEVVGITWHVAGAGISTLATRSLEELRAALRGLDLQDGADYAISNITPGAPLGPTYHRTYFECTEDAARRFSRFDAVFRIRSLHGDVYERPVRLLPHTGASEQTASASVT